MKFREISIILSSALIRKIQGISVKSESTIYASLALMKNSVIVVGLNRTKEETIHISLFESAEKNGGHWILHGWCFNLKIQIQIQKYKQKKITYT